MIKKSSWCTPCSLLLLPRSRPLCLFSRQCAPDGRDARQARLRRISRACHDHAEVAGCLVREDDETVFSTFDQGLTHLLNVVHSGTFQESEGAVEGCTQTAFVFSPSLNIFLLFCC